MTTFQEKFVDFGFGLFLLGLGLIFLTICIYIWTHWDTAIISCR